MKINATEIRVGMILEYKNDLWEVLKTNHVKPGKGGAFAQVEMKSLMKNTKLNERFRSSETIEKASLDEIKYNFLYSDENDFYFMNPNSFEQININKNIMGEKGKMLVENLEVLINFYNDKPLNINLPNQITCKINETDAALKGQTVSSSYKPATLENGISIQVPPFIENGDTIIIEPFRANAFPVIKDLVVDRSSFDRIQQAGGFISINTSGNTQDANTIPVDKYDADKAFDAATCIGCGACVASCKNASAMLFVSAKVSQFSLLPQGKVEARDRVLNMVNQMDEEGFGNCTNTGACEVECPKGISLENIARMNREYLWSSIKG
mgnify:CR=1 FL=1